MALHMPNKIVTANAIIQISHPSKQCLSTFIKKFILPSPKFHISEAIGSLFILKYTLTLLFLNY